MTPAEREYHLGQSSTSIATKWARANWDRLPELAVYRALSHWGIFNKSVPRAAWLANIALLLGGLAGWLFVVRGRPRQVLLLILILDTLIVAVTWAHLGRYAIPLRPLIHVGTGILVAAIAQRLPGNPSPVVQDAASSES